MGEKYDAESIVSTYSNLEHHPTVISFVPKKKKKSKKDQRVRLSKKTGMPIEEVAEEEDRPEECDLEDEDGFVDDGMSVASTVIPTRRRGETKQEKKARKTEAKER